jgi:GNAT superfamily N-acetyltransferase
MGITYFKRFRMEIDLVRTAPILRELARGYRLVPWHESLLPVHAEIKYRSFCSEIDAHVFPCLSELAGCQRLMREIVCKPGFLRDATWLAARMMPDGSLAYCGCIQAVRDELGMGSVQNLGVLPDHRGLGLGACLLLKTLESFRRLGLRRGMLEVTAQNSGAVRLYRDLGFRKARTVYKVAEVCGV